VEGRKEIFRHERLTRRENQNKKKRDSQNDKENPTEPSSKKGKKIKGAERKEGEAVFDKQRTPGISSRCNRGGDDQNASQVRDTK